MYNYKIQKVVIQIVIQTTRLIQLYWFVNKNHWKLRSTYYYPCIFWPPFLLASCQMIYISSTSFPPIPSDGCTISPTSRRDSGQVLKQKMVTFKLNSYSNAIVFLLLCRMRISVFWGHERLTNRLISRRYLKSNIATWVERSLTSRAFHARDTWFYWSSENTLHERFIASSDIWVWMKTIQLIAKR